MVFQKNILFLLLGLLFYSCAAIDSIYNSNYPLTNKLIQSENTSLTIQEPVGWFRTIDNECYCNDILLVRDDYSAAITINPLNFNNQSKIPLLNDAVTLSKTLRKVDLGNSFRAFEKDEEYSINGIQMIAFQYRDENDLPARVIILKYKNNFYEIEALIKPIPGGKPVKPFELFAVQNSVAASIR